MVLNMAIKEIFCQDRAISILEQGYSSGRMAHAYIFAGMEGVGKFKTAFEWAKLLLCKEPIIKKDFADSCGKCQSCIEMDALSHPDFEHIYKELRQWTEEGANKAPPTEMPIDVIREFLIDKVAIRPSFSERKVFVVSEGEKLNRESQNALLKVLEEPPGYCTIILLCTQPESLLPTIRSRCQMIRFGPVSEEKIIERLERDGLNKKQAQYFARLCGGSLGLACIWAKLKEEEDEEAEKEEFELYKSAQKLAGELADCKYADSLFLADKFLRESKALGKIWEKITPNVSRTDINRRAHKTYITIIISVLSDCIRLKESNDKKIVNFEQEAKIKKMAEKFTTEQLCGRITAAYEALERVDASVNEKLLYHPLLLKVLSFDTIEVSKSQMVD